MDYFPKSQLGEKVKGGGEDIPNLFPNGNLYPALMPLGVPIGLVLADEMLVVMILITSGQKHLIAGVMSQPLLAPAS